MTTTYYTDVDRPTTYTAARLALLCASSMVLSDGSYGSNLKVLDDLRLFHLAAHGIHMLSGVRATKHAVTAARADLLDRFGVVVHGDVEPEAE